MIVDLIKEASQGNTQKEMDLLELEIMEGTKEIDVYTRLCQLYRKKKSICGRITSYRWV